MRFSDGLKGDVEKFAGIQTILESIRVDYMTFDEFIVGKNYDKVLHCVSLCEDDRSKYVYTEFLSKRLNNCFDCRDLVENNSYFAIPHFLEEDYNEVYVDVGAFVGDT